MKNLKKVLALVLVVAMMMTFAVSASAATYKDADQITYDEAVAVVSGIGVLDGADGSFNPQGNLTREQAAKIIAYLELGKTVAEQLSVSASSFTDVEATRWSAKYIEYCVSKGIVSGHAGKFNPTGTLKGVEFAKMLLVALGYDAAAEGMTGASWEINTSRLAVKAGIDNKFALSGTITREQAAQMVFSTLSANTVSYAQKGTSITIGDTVINTGSAPAEPNKTTYAEENYKDLKCDKSGTDDLGRLGNTWTVGKTTIGTFGNLTKQATYTAAVTEAAAAKEYGKTVFAADAKIVTNSKDAQKTEDVADDAKVADTVVAKAANGVVVEVWVNAKQEVAQIIVIEPTFAQVTVTEKKATKTQGARVEYKVAGMTANEFTSVVDETKDITNVEVNGTVENNDMVLAYQGAKNVYITAVEAVSGTCTAVSKNKVVTIDGTAYNYAKQFDFGEKNKNALVPSKTPVSVYVDENNFILGLVAPQKVVKTYCIPVAEDTTAALENGKLVYTTTVTAVLTDGTFAEFVVAKEGTKLNVVSEYSTKNGITTFTSEESTITDAKATALTKITAKNAVLADGVYANAATKFVFLDYTKNAKDEDVLAGTATTYTGIANVGTYESIKTAYAFDTSAKADGIADIVIVVSNVKAKTVITDYVYLTGDYTQTVDGYIYDAIIKGETTTITYKDNKLTAGLYTDIESAEKATKDADSVQNNGGLLFLGDKYNGKSIADDAVVYVIDANDNSVVEKTGADLATKVEGEVYVIDQNNAVKTVFVIIPVEA